MRKYLILLIVVTLVAVIFAGCTSSTPAPASLVVPSNPMPEPIVVKPNDTVKVYYTATKASNGQPFESSLNGTPIEFVVGSGTVIPGFDTAVTGMSIGEKKTVTIPADQAYGPRIQSLVNVLPKDVVLATLSVKDPDAWNPKPGDSIRFVKPDGTIGYVYILTANETSITIDENHLLAGEDLIFTIQIVDIAHTQVPVTQKASTTIIPKISSAPVSTVRSTPVVTYVQKSATPTSLSGNGDDTKPLTIQGGGGFIIQGSYSGKSNFIVVVKDSNGEQVGTSIFNEIGTYSGKKIASLNPGKYFFEVQAEGPWSIVISST